MRDFTLITYKILLQKLLTNGYSIIPFEEYFTNKPKGKFVILRHDVDIKPAQSLKTAEIENELKIRATYYFRIQIAETRHIQIIKNIITLGHEIGYHYEDLNLLKGNFKNAINQFQKNLEYFRRFYPIKTIAMHGSPREKYDNRDLWKQIDYHKFNVLGEPYFDFLNKSEILYFTDTGRMWNGHKYNIRDKAMVVKSQTSINIIHTTFDLLHWIETVDNKSPIMINTHPQRWTNNIFHWYFELISQTLKNQIKAILVKKNSK